ncbi:MAG TPA: MdtA/MuxA family multidrug efflux RND transporter periplasmic adaptor subunit [Bryobacteraceae bacterium]|nr:MdtA/MuxA family multidrug efflux RND transporter periplasmic adaptor subunit [Bryobacteraceae bacterium]
MNQESRSALDPAAPAEVRSKPLPALPPEPPRRSSKTWVWLLVLAVLAAGAYYYWAKRHPAQNSATAGAAAQRKGFGAIPVVAAKARRGNIPVYFTGIGAVTPIYTVTVRSRVDGELMQIHYKEGDIVQKGAPLIEIDPRPYEAALVQAQGQLVRDQALLDNARIDLARYKTLLTQNAIPEQQLATQQALVTQDEGIVKADQGAIDTAKLNVTYSHITAPITGRIGLRLVDPGNIVHAADTTGMLVITQIDPISVIFTLAEDQLPVVSERFWHGQHLTVEAWNRDPAPLSKKLATGTLTTLDNQIDPTTGTLRLRADFDNKDNKLFPEQFVNVKLLVEMKQNVVLIPTATVQRNSQITYEFLVKPDSTVTVRPITIGTTEGDETEVISGLNAGDEVVMTGVDKLQEGTKVSAHLAGTAPPAQTGSALPAGAASHQGRTSAAKGR